MYYLNKIVMGLANPMSVGLLLLAAGLLVRFAMRPAGPRCVRVAWGFVIAAFVWLTVWASPLLMPDLSRRLEQMYPPQLVDVLPKADAVVLLGGGMSMDPEGESVYPEMHEGADRVWHAARIWRAGKAPLVFASGTNEAYSSVVLLKDLGVPDEAIVREGESRNTEENARFVARKLGPGRRILLVTSSWHMRRAVLMFRKYAPDVEVVPAACDYESLCCKDELTFEALFPTADVMSGRTKALKEILGYWGYRFLRRASAR